MKKPLSWNIMLNKLSLFLVFEGTFLFLLLTACNNNSGNDKTKMKITTAGIESDESLKVYSNTDSVSSQKSETDEVLTGTVEVPLNQITYVSLPLGGIVKRLHIQEPTFVREGELLATISHPDYVKLQQQYLESKGKLEYLKQEFQRQGELTIENASSIKKLQKSESEYLTEEANCVGLKAQLQLLGIHPDSLNPDNIIIYLRVVAPKSGYLTTINAVQGMYHQPNEWLFEITNRNNLDLTFYLDEKHHKQLVQGMLLVFYLPDNPDKKYQAKLRNWVKRVNTDGKIKTYATIEKEAVQFLMPGMTVICENMPVAISSNNEKKLNISCIE